MATTVRDEFNLVLEAVGVHENVKLMAMHLSEVEDEAGNVLDLLTLIRSHAYRGDVQAGQESLAELTIALEHLFHHIQRLIPDLQKQLDLESG